MRKSIKKITVTALTGIMAMSMLTGCGKEEKLDGSKIAATINGTEIPMGIVSLAARQQQAQAIAMYMSFMGSADNIWDTVYDEESGLTYGQETVSDVMEQVANLYVLKEKAADYGIEVTEEDQAAIAKAAAAFMADNSEETIAELAVTEEQVKEFLELETYSARVRNAVLSEAEVEVTDEEAQQSAFSYVNIYGISEETTEEELAEKKAQAQEILDAMLADPSADMTEVAASVSEDISAHDGTFATYAPEDAEEESSAYPQEVIDVLRGLEEGEVAPEVIETDTNLYIVRLDSKLDEEATEEERSQLEDEKKNEYYSELSAEWMEAADLKIDEDVLKTLTITDSHMFTLKMEEPAEDEFIEEEIIEDGAEDADAEEIYIEDLGDAEEELVDDLEETDDEVIIADDEVVVEE